jgi:hypothetical protein
MAGRACIIREKRLEIELTCGSGANSVPAGVPEPQRDPGGGAGSRGVVVLHRHLNANPSPLRDWRRHVQDDADAHLLRRGHEARMARDQRGQSKAEEEGGEGEARRRVRCHLPLHRPRHKRATAATRRLFFQRRSRSLYAVRMQAARGDCGILRRADGDPM